MRLGKQSVGILLLAVAIVIALNAWPYVLNGWKEQLQNVWHSVDPFKSK